MSPAPGRASKAAGLKTFTEENITCCYAMQDKVWIEDSDSNMWEVFVVKGDAPMIGGLQRAEFVLDLFPQFRREAVDVHLEVLVLAVWSDKGFDDLAHCLDRFAFPDADTSSVILGSCVNG
jgi:hypothetical protein